MFYGFLRNSNLSIITELIKRLLYTDIDNVNTYDIYYDIPDRLTEFSEKFTIEEKKQYL